MLNLFYPDFPMGAKHIKTSAQKEANKLWLHRDDLEWRAKEAERSRVSGDDLFLYY